MASNLLYASAGAGVALVIFTAIGLIGGIALFFTFMSKKNEGRFTGFLGWLYGFLNFKSLLAESLLRALYAIAACTTTLVSLVVLFSGVNFGIAFLGFLVILVFGNAIVRILYEFMLIKLIVAKNTSEINAKLGYGTSSPTAGPDAPPPTYPTPPSAPASAPTPAAPPAGLSCPSCGTAIGSVEQFCPKCGTKLR
jgi:hypothetical protein